MCHLVAKKHLGLWFNLAESQCPCFGNDCLLLPSLFYHLYYCYYFQRHWPEATVKTVSPEAFSSHPSCVSPPLLFLSGCILGSSYLFLEFIPSPSLCHNTASSLLFPIWTDFFSFNYRLLVMNLKGI